ncbi:ATP-binding protein [Leptospira alstonii]|uniref:ATP-binding protein n=1 Tax=Leptospira alstonii TaxID=28452 RepID=UPI000774B95D|nr:ATP-binding protein [Leptospira alstonii]
MNLKPEIFICSVFLFLSSVLFWLASITIVNLERRDRSATFTILILIIASFLFGFFSLVGESGLLEISNYPVYYFLPGIFCLILVPFGWFFIVVWFVGFLREKIIYRTIFGILLFSQVFSFLFLINWSRKFFINVSLFHFWNIVPFSFRLSYLIYILICIVVPIISLSSFKISKSILPEIARKKAVPYLKTVSFLLLGVFILVFLLFLGGGLGFFEDPILQSVRDGQPSFFYGILIGIQTLIVLSVLVIGKALVSYEVFTGRILPKISLRKEWRNAILGFSIISAIYILLAAIGFFKIELFLTASYVSILSRTFILKKNKDLRIKENSILRSIVTSEEISENPSSDIQEIRDKFQKSFETLCSSILETSKSLFVNESRIPFIADLYLEYPKRENYSKQNTFKNKNLFFEKDNIAYLDDENFSGFVLCLKVESDHSGEGFLFLGQKVDGGLYAEEEIETAKSVIVWILNSLSIESNSQTLSFLQRKHMEEQRISDYKTRRILHDEILPEIHSSILSLSGNKSEETIPEQIKLLTDLHKKVSGFLRELPDTSLEIARLGLIDALIRLTTSEFDASWFLWNYDPELKDKFPITKLEILEILFYACRESIRNAVKYSGEVIRKPVSISFEEKNGILIRIRNSVEINKNDSIESAGQGLRIHSALLKIFGGYVTLDFLNTQEALVEIYLPEDKIDLNG